MTLTGAELSALSVVICPGCARHLRPTRGDISCPYCGYETPDFKTFPTVAKIIREKKAEWSEVQLGAFLLCVLAALRASGVEVADDEEGA